MKCVFCGHVRRLQGNSRNSNDYRSPNDLPLGLLWHKLGASSSRHAKRPGGSCADGIHRCGHGEKWVYRGCTWIMEKRMETTNRGLGV